MPRTISVFRDISSVAWVNDGAHARQIVFVDGSCRTPISPSRRELHSQGCVTSRLRHHPYRIVGLAGRAAQGVVVVRPLRFRRRQRPSSSSRERRRVGPKRARVGPVIARLRVEHADAGIALRFRSDVELLVSVMLSAQTTDVNVNRVTTTLFREVPPAGGRARRPAEEVEPTSTRAGSSGRRRRRAAGRADAVAEYGGGMPRAIAELVGLPGVARKTANVVARRARRNGGRSSSTRTCAGSRCGSDSRAERSGEDRAGPACGSYRARTGRVPAPADLARPPRLPREQAGVRGLRPGGHLPRKQGLGGSGETWSRPSGRAGRHAAASSSPRYLLRTGDSLLPLPMSAKPPSPLFADSGKPTPVSLHRTRPSHPAGVQRSARPS